MVSASGGKAGARPGLITVVASTNSA